MNHTAFFLGMALLQAVFVAYHFVLFKRKEFVYYLLYTLCICTFIYFKSFPQYNPLSYLVLPHEPFTLGRSVLLTGVALYYRFGRHFTEMPVLYPTINRICRIVERSLFLFSAVDISLLLYGVHFNVLEPFSQKIYIAMMLISLVVIVFLIVQKRMLTTILVSGSGVFLLFAACTFLHSIFIAPDVHPETYYMAWMEMGMGGEFLLLNFGLIYKTRLLQKQNLRLEVEKEMAVQRQELEKMRVVYATREEERLRIARDLHDDMGSTLSSIGIYANVVQSYLATEQEKASSYLQKIQTHTRQLMESTADLIWSLQTNYGVSESIYQRMSRTATDLLAGANIASQISIDAAQLPQLTIAAQKTYWLIFKEALNNVCKYSRATNCNIYLFKKDGTLVLRVTDDGVGFAGETAGNGLRNMVSRAQSLKGNCLIETAPGKGTLIEVALPLSAVCLQQNFAIGHELPQA